MCREENICDHDDVDLCNVNKLESFRVKRTSTLAAFKELCAEKFGVPAERQRFWKFINRQNKTKRFSAMIPEAYAGLERRCCFCTVMCDAQCRRYTEPIVRIFKNTRDCKLFMEESPVEVAEVCA